MEHGCAHYKRACMKKCEECNEFFTCRFCHDDAKYLNERDVKKAHNFNRFATKQVKCLICSHVQDVTSCITLMRFYRSNRNVSLVGSNLQGTTAMCANSLTMSSLRRKISIVTSAEYAGSEVKMRHFTAILVERACHYIC